MCGIAGFAVRDSGKRPIDSEKLLDELIRGIDERGGDATGFVAINGEGQTEWHKASCAARRFIPGRRPMPTGVLAALAHTRYATQGHEAFPENNHPLKRGPIYVVHNGVITNDDALFVKAQRTRYGQVDSEAIAAMLSQADKLWDAGAAMEAIEGSAAIAALDERDGGILLARISSSPLWVIKTRRLVLWASTRYAVENAHKRAIGSLGRAKAQELDEGDAWYIAPDGTITAYRFTPPPIYRKAYVPTPNYGKAETTGSYMPSYLKTSHWLDRDEDEDYRGGRAPIAALGALDQWDEDEDASGDVPCELECEICSEEIDEGFDLLDGDDVWHVCASCLITYATSEAHTR